MIKTAVIGASGYIGTYLLRRYREVFPDCIGTGFSRSQNNLTHFDLCHPDVTQLKLEETGHQAVIIASAMPNVSWCEAYPKESYELNVKGTLEFVKQISHTGLTTLFLSSDYVFNGESGGYSDKSLPSPITEYGRQKAEVEREIPNLTDNYAILRLSKIYGTTWKDNTLLDALAAAFMENQTVTAAVDQFFSPTHVNDVVAMIQFVQQKNLKGLLNLCHNHSYSRYQIASQLAKAMHVSSNLVQGVNLHSIPTMQNRPLNTSLKCLAPLENMQLFLMCIDESIKKVAAN